MIIKDLLADAIEFNQKELQALIMFALHEGRIKSFDESTKQLNYYFLKENVEEKGKEINEYAEKIGINRFEGVFEIETNTNIVYVYANSASDALYKAKEGKVNRIMLDNDKMTVNGRNRTINEMIKNKKKPTILGGYQK